MQDSVNKILNEVLKKVVSEADTENDNYKTALLLRIKSTIESIQILYSSSSFLDTPVLARVAFEHACRLLQYERDPASITKGFPTAYKLLGKSPGVKFAISELGEELKNIYTLLSAFTHADLTSLMLSLSGKDGNEDLISVVIEMSYIVILYILAKVYPEQDLTDEMIGRRLMSSTNTLLKYIATTVMSSPNLVEINNLITTYELFADSKVNELATKFLSQAIQDTNKSMDYLFQYMKD